MTTPPMIHGSALRDRPDPGGVALLPDVPLPSLMVSGSPSSRSVPRRRSLPTPAAARLFPERALDPAWTRTGSARITAPDDAGHHAASHHAAGLMRMRPAPGPIVIEPDASAATGTTRAG